MTLSIVGENERVSWDRRDLDCNPWFGHEHRHEHEWTLTLCQFKVSWVRQESLPKEQPSQPKCSQEINFRLQFCTTEDLRWLTQLRHFFNFQTSEPKEEESLPQSKCSFLFALRKWLRRNCDCQFCDFAIFWLSNFPWCTHSGLAVQWHKLNLQLIAFQVQARYGKKSTKVDTAIC